MHSRCPEECVGGNSSLPTSAERCQRGRYSCCHNQFARFPWFRARQAFSRAHYIGFSVSLVWSVVAAGYFIPRAFGAAISATGNASFAVSFFLAFYVACVMVTWWCYLRRSLLVAQVPSLAYASV